MTISYTSIRTNYTREISQIMGIMWKLCGNYVELCGNCVELCAYLYKGSNFAKLCGS
jgi:hypothetical protein